MIYVRNLTGALIACLEHPRATSEVFLVADAEVITTQELVVKLAALMGRAIRVVPVPPRLLRLGGRLLGRPEDVDRLLNSLVVSTEKIRTLLSWSPPVSFDQGLAETVAWHRLREGTGR